MTNKEFLEWFDTKMGSLTTGVRKGQTPEYQAEAQKKSKRDKSTRAAFSSNPENYQQQWYVIGRCVSEFQQFDSWYTGNDGRKVYPDDLTLTPLMAKMWYVTDGWLDNREYQLLAKISCYNEIEYRDNGNFIGSLFEDQGFSVRTDEKDIIMCGNEETEKFFEWIGRPPNGFSYKWPDKFC